MQTFNKSERLCSTFHKEKLFSEGKRLFVFPFGITYIVERKNNPVFSSHQKIDEAADNNQITGFGKPCKILISAPKKLFKKAVIRNKVKRLVREAFRKNKTLLYSFLEENQLNCLLSVVYSSETILPYSKIEEKMMAGLKALRADISKTINDNNY